MAGTFGARMDELAEMVGDGILRGQVEVDQVYARYQHERLDLRHPEGGRAKYLGGPLLENTYRYIQELADSLLTGQLRGQMVKTMEDLSQKVYDNAPREFNDLRASGHPTVVDDEYKIYDRMPFVHRLTEAELRAKGDLRRLGLGNERNN
jgi:hypothetical protein